MRVDNSGQAFGVNSSRFRGVPTAYRIVKLGQLVWLPAAAALLTADVVAAGELTIEPSIELREGFSDNIDLDAEGDEEAAFIFEFVPGVSLRSESARTTSALDAFPIIRHQTAGEDKGISFDANLTGLGNVEVLEDLFFVDAQASISQQVLNNTLASSTANDVTVQVYSVSPSLQHRFGSFAEGEARYRLGQVFLGDSDTTTGAATVGGEVSDSTTQELRASLQSGDDFTRFSWTLNASVSEENRTDDDDVSRREFDAELRYALNRSITLIAAGGYQVFDDGEPANEVNGPTWRAGVRLRPGPRTDLAVTYGERDDARNADVDFTYRITSRTRVTARYSEVLENPQERLVRGVSDLGLESDTSQFISQNTGDPFDPNLSPFDIDNDTVRVRTIAVGLRGVRGRNTFGVDAAILNEKTEPSGEEENVWRASARFSRRLTPHLTANLFAGYERIEFDDGQIDNEYSARGGLSYQLYSNVTAGLEYGYRLQNSTLPTAEFRENRIFGSVRIQF